jgi:hypothetical protein
MSFALEARAQYIFLNTHKIWAMIAIAIAG